MFHSHILVKCLDLVPYVKNTDEVGCDEYRGGTIVPRHIHTATIFPIYGIMESRITKTKLICATVKEESLTSLRSTYPMVKRSRT